MGNLLTYAEVSVEDGRAGLSSRGADVRKSHWSPFEIGSVLLEEEEHMKLVCNSLVKSVYEGVTSVWCHGMLCVPLYCY